MLSSRRSKSDIFLGLVGYRSCLLHEKEKNLNYAATIMEKKKNVLFTRERRTKVGKLAKIIFLLKKLEVVEAKQK